MGAVKEANIFACEDIERIRCELNCWYLHCYELQDSMHILGMPSQRKILSAINTIRSIASAWHNMLFEEYIEQDPSIAANIPDWIARKGRWADK